METNEVHIAFEILLEEIGEVFNILSNESQKAFQNMDLDKANSLIEYIKKLKAFREEVKALQNKWQNEFENTVKKNIKQDTKTSKGRLKRGLRTPEKAYIIPILKSLQELNGKAKMQEVLEKVYELMKDILNEYDMESLPSIPQQKRWENAVQWARNTMVNNGLLKKDSPHGIWEITEKGIKYLLEEDNQSNNQ